MINIFRLENENACVFVVRLVSGPQLVMVIS